MISGARLRDGRLIRWATIIAATVTKTRPRKRADLPARSLSKRMLLPFCTAIFLFFLVLICIAALRPTNTQPPTEIRGILTILR
jgi:hypothetical protein